MAKWARIENNIVVEITTEDPSGRFHEDILWESIPELVEVGYAKNGVDFVAPEPLPVPELDFPEQPIDAEAPIGGFPA